MYSIGSQSCLRFLFLKKILCDYISAFQMETDSGFIAKIIVLRVFQPLFHHC